MKLKSRQKWRVKKLFYFIDYFRRGRSPSPASHDEYDEPEHAAAERLLERGKYLIYVY